MEEELARVCSIAAELVAGKQASASSDKFKALAAEGLLTLLRLRKNNRILAQSTEELKEDTSKAKTHLEQADLQLQNLLYEKQYYEKEIRSCRSFRSAVPDEVVSLQPVEAFWASDDEDLKQIARDKGTEHELMLQRLAQEIRLRKKLQSDLDGLKQAKIEVTKKVQEQTKVLKDLQSTLKSLEENAKPLQSVLSGYPALKGLGRGHADLLPLPLYVLYSQLAAAKDALNLPVSVTIHGQVEEAEAFARQTLADPDDQTTGAAATQSADDVQPSRKRQRLSPIPAPKNDAYKVHPLTVQLDVLKEQSSKPSDVMISVKFQYLVNIKLVTAQCDSAADNQLLAALFPSDDGSRVPSEAVAQMESGTFRFDVSRPAKPYRWCQHLAGLDFVPALPLATQLQNGSEQALVLDGLDTYRKQQRVVTVVSRLRAVKEANAALK
mmetsp:Transcript_37376/g.83177  ORF Transcript_37376/g.83177 Transcript_37376/m.83177 type:complete len:438 (+) Transcript_37376:84-1397(+)